MRRSSRSVRLSLVALHAAGYLDSTIGQYEKTIRALAVFVDDHGGVYTPSLGARVRVDDDQPTHGPVQCAAQAAATGGWWPCSTAT